MDGDIQHDIKEKKCHLGCSRSISAVVSFDKVRKDYDLQRSTI